MHPLDGAHAKWRRAGEHLDALDAESTAFVNSNPYSIVDKYYAKTCHVTFRYAEAHRPDLLRWALIIGDALHGFNSALDHMAWQFALTERPKPSKKTAWPVCTEDGDWASKPVRSMVRHIPEPYLTFIRERQPYPAPDGIGPESHAFAMLRTLANIDKHRVLHTAVPVPEDLNLKTFPNADAGQITESEVFFDRPIKQGTKIARIRIEPSGPNPEVKMGATGTLYIALVGPEYGWMNGGEVFYILRAIEREVRNTLNAAHAVMEAAGHS